MGWFIDFLSFVVWASLLAGTIYGCIKISRQFSDSMAAARESLKAKGIDYTNGTISVTGKKRFNREDELDATQRGFMKAMGAASFGKADDIDKKPVLERQISETGSVASVHDSVGGTEEKRRHRFRKNH